MKIETDMTNKKDATQALAVTDTRIQQNFVAKKKQEEEKEQLSRSKKDLEEQIKKYQTHVGEIRKHQARRETSEEDDVSTCAVCFEKYDKNNHQQACIISCFHSFCISCLTSLNPKTCPKCLKSFIAEEIKKIF